jgi:hypothetical protein
MGAERLDVIGGVKVAVIAEQHVALGVDRLQQIAAGTVFGEAELAADLVLEDLKGGAAVVPTGAAIGINKLALQQPFLAQVLHVLERFVAFFGGRFHLAGSGSLELQFTAGELTLQLLLLSFGLMKALVFVLERLGWFGARGQGFLAGLIEALFRVEVVISVGIVNIQLVCQDVRLQRQLQIPMIISRADRQHIKAFTNRQRLTAGPALKIVVLEPQAVLGRSPSCSVRRSRCQSRPAARRR